jgi:hypothetical protein
MRITGPGKYLALLLRVPAAITGVPEFQELLSLLVNPIERRCSTSRFYFAH